MSLPPSGLGTRLSQICGRRDPYGNWFAWYASRPNHASLGETPHEALAALLSRSNASISDWNVRAMARAYSEGLNEFEIDLATDTPCPECHGTGRYVGLTHVENCGMCQGSGQLALKAPPQATMSAAPPQQGESPVS